MKYVIRFIKIVENKFEKNETKMPQSPCSDTHVETI